MPDIGSGDSGSNPPGISVKMRRKMGLFLPIVLVVGIFFFLMLGITILSKAPAPDENRTPALAAEANATEAFQQPVQLGWQGAALAITACGVLAVAGMLVRSLRGRRRRW